MVLALDLSLMACPFLLLTLSPFRIPAALFLLRPLHMAEAELELPLSPSPWTERGLGGEVRHRLFSTRSRRLFAL